MTKKEFRVYEHLISNLLEQMSLVVRYINYMNNDSVLSHNEERDKKYLEYAVQSKNNISELLRNKDVKELYNTGYKKYMEEDIAKYNKVIWDKRKRS